MVRFTGISWPPLNVWGLLPPLKLEVAVWLRLLVWHYTPDNKTYKDFMVYWLLRLWPDFILQIEEALLQRKKLELLQKYASDDLQAEEGEVKQMLGLWCSSVCVFCHKHYTLWVQVTPSGECLVWMLSCAWCKKEGWDLLKYWYREHVYGMLYLLM